MIDAYNSIRYRHIRAALVAESEWDSRLSHADRLALAFTSAYSGGLIGIGLGGYECEYLPCDSYGSAQGSILCAACALDYLKEDSQHAVIPACFVNMERPYGGEYCGSCGSAIVEPYCAECGRDEADLDKGVELIRPGDGDSYAPHYCTDCLAELNE